MSKQKKPETIVSVDIGRTNLAVFVYNAVKRRGIYWKIFDTNLKTFNSNEWKAAMVKIVEKIQGRLRRDEARAWC